MDHHLEHQCKSMLQPQPQPAVPPTGVLAMLSKLSEDEQRNVFIQLCNVLDPRGAVNFSSASNGLWALTQALRQQLRADHVERALEACGGDFDSALEQLTQPAVPPTAPSPPALPLPTGGLTNLEDPDPSHTQVTDAGCAALASALNSGALPALIVLNLDGIPASVAAKDAVHAALARSRASRGPYCRCPGCGEQLPVSLMDHHLEHQCKSRLQVRTFPAL